MQGQNYATPTSNQTTHEQIITDETMFVMRIGSLVF